jgi:hypothetical protein
MDQATFSLSDLFDEEPKLYHIIDDEWDLVSARALAREDVLKQVAATSVDQRARVFTSAHEFKHAAVFAALKRIYRKQSGDDAQQLYDRYRAEFEAEVAKVCGVVPRDSDQDSTIEEDEKVYARSRRIVR